MYSSAFCKVYNEFGWNYFPEAFGEQLLSWIRYHEIPVKTSLDLACGTGVLCEVMQANGINARGMDFSEGMIAIARERNREIPYEVADMITYRPNEKFDLVTCTGDALNHIIDLKDVKKIFENVYSYLAEGGYFIFDLLNEREISDSEPFELDFSDAVKAVFCMKREGALQVKLHIRVSENGVQTFEEVITEKVHDPEMICRLLETVGFTQIRCGHTLAPESPSQAVTWFIIAKK